MDLGRISRLRLHQDGIWWPPTAPESFSFPSDGHDKTLRIEERSFWFAHRNRCLLSVLGRYAPAGALFDIGGGNGFVAHALTAAGLEVVLLEPSPVGASNARRRGVENVACATLDDAAFCDGSLAAAGLFDVLEHVRDDGGFLRRLHRALASDGRLYLTVPAFPFLWSGEDEYAGHFRRYTSATLHSVLRTAGFRIEWLTYFFGALLAPLLVVRVLPSLLGVQNRDAVVAKSESHHLGGGPLVRGTLGAALAAEFALIDRGIGVPAGSSIIAVARRE